MDLPGDGNEEVAASHSPRQHQHSRNKQCGGRDHFSHPHNARRALIRGNPLANHGSRPNRCGSRRSAGPDLFGQLPHNPCELKIVH
jgi:hypothetical protein